MTRHFPIVEHQLYLADVTASGTGETGAAERGPSNWHDVGAFFVGRFSLELVLYLLLESVITLYKVLGLGLGHVS